MYKYALFSICFSLLISCSPPVAPTDNSSPPSASGPIDQIAAGLDSRGGAGIFSGAVAIAKDGVTVLEKAYGFADKAYAIPNTPTTRFASASMSKMFTGVAIMQLVAAGKVDLQATVGSYLPGYPSKEVRDQVTLHHLLTHTSGLPDFMTDTYLDFAKDQFRTVADFAPFFQDELLEYSPGDRFIYRNSDYILLGLIIEAVSGQSFYDYVQDHIFAPTGMSNTDFPEWDHPEKNRATGYTASVSQPGELMANHYLVSARGGPFGGGAGTVGDFLKFAAQLRTH